MKSCRWPSAAGTFNGGVTVTDNAGARVVKTFTITIAAAARGQSLLALTRDGHLLTFDSTAPDKIVKDVAITGLVKDDVLHTLAVTPQGKVYGIAGTAGSSEVGFDRLYTLDPATGAAVPIALTK